MSFIALQGIKSMQDTGPKVVPIRKKVKARRQRQTKITDNDHLSSILQSYDDS